MDYLMAIDLGSTSLKALIFDLDGNIVSSAGRATEKITPDGHPEWVIWDPDQIWNDSAAAVKEALAGIDDPSQVKAVAVTGMGMDGVPVDAGGGQRRHRGNERPQRLLRHLRPGRQRRGAARERNHSRGRLLQRILAAHIHKIGIH